ncbi:TM2 domain-containing protein [Akkermansiaceae bacterium]|nr:TM2 domain-containing protein [Akkermansiaceae bacterium]
MSEETPAPEQAAPPAPEQTPPPVAAPPNAPAAEESYPKEQTDKKLIAGILGIVLGSFGVHKLYLGYTVPGVIMLSVGLVGLFVCGLPTMAVGIVGLIEGILYLTKTDSEFVKTYVVGKKEWF